MNTRFRGYRIHTFQVAGAPLPQLAGEGGAERRMGCGPLAQPKPHCTTGAANLLEPSLLSAPHPAFGHLPRFAEKGNPWTARNSKKSIVN